MAAVGKDTAEIRLVELKDELSEDIKSKITQDLENHAQAELQAAAASSSASSDHDGNGSLKATESLGSRHARAAKSD